MYWIIGIIITGAILYFIAKNQKKDPAATINKETTRFPISWKAILEEKVEYYRSLPGDKKLLFEEGF
jgi:hypothetical protein